MICFPLGTVKRGLRLMQKKNFNEAVKYFSRAVEKGSSLDDAHFYLGACYFELGDLPAAKEHLHAALELNSRPDRVSEILEIVNWNMVSPYNYFNSCQAFSPDGSRLVFSCAKKDTNGDGKINALDLSGIYIADLSSGKQECLVKDDNINTRPVFSPDSKRIAYISQQQRGPEGPARQRLFILDMHSLSETEFLKDYSVKYHHFAHNGKDIIFCGWKEGDKKNGIYSLDIDKGSVTTLVPAVYENTFPSLSPDGNRLLYTSWRTDTNGDGIIDFYDNSGIYIRDLTTGIEKELVSSDFNNSFPSFSPDGKQILYLSVRRDTCGDGIVDSIDNAGIYLLDIDKGREKCLIDDTFYNKFPNFGPDGKKIVFLTSGCHFRITCSKKDFFVQKGVYMLDIKKHDYYQIMSERYYGCRAPVLSPKGDKVAYVSWRKDSNRGLYIADIGRLPLKEVLHEWIDKNLI